MQSIVTIRACSAPDRIAETAIVVDVKLCIGASASQGFGYSENCFKQLLSLTLRN